VAAIPFGLQWAHSSRPATKTGDSQLNLVTTLLMQPKKFLLNPTRTAKQGSQINVGKFTDEYQKIVTTLEISAADMESLGVAEGDSVSVRTEFGEATFQCTEANVPDGLLFIPYGPPTCRLMGGDTDGTGMPTSKGWEVEVERVDAPQ
jgi:formylmethanofuran dehydrogenase subunit D